MNIKSKKGYALVLAMVFIIILLISSIGLYHAIEHAVREVRVQEVSYIRGQYAAMAGLRYAKILLRNPGALFDGVGGRDLPHNGDIYPVTGMERVGNFFANIGEVDPANPNLTITITEYDPTDPQWAVDNYRVRAIYQY